MTVATKVLTTFVGVVVSSGAQSVLEMTPVKAAIRDTERAFAGKIEGVGEALQRWMASEDALALLRQLESAPHSLSVGSDLVTSFLKSDFFHREETDQRATHVLNTFLDALNQQLLQDPKRGLLIHELREEARFKQIVHDFNRSGLPSGTFGEMDIAEANARWEQYTNRANATIEPSTLERVRREVVPRVYIPHLRQKTSADSAKVVFLIGEAGYGKTTILGQLYAEAISDDVGWVRLLLAGDLPTDASLATGPDVARIMGQAVCGARVSLAEMVSALVSEKGRGLVLIDTLDLVLSRTFVTGLGLLLQTLVSAGTSVVLTCRRPEYQGLLEPLADRLGGVARHADAFQVPTFSELEISAAVSAYFRRSIGEATTEEADRFTSALLSRSVSNRPFREIIESPLLLILVCELFASEQQLPPEDLTVHRLYEVWWERRVRSSRKFDPGTLELHRKEQVCLTVAKQLFEASTHGIHESIYETDVRREKSQDEAALRDLVSDDVLRAVETSGRLRFFHQTFLEYAIARWLTTSAGKAHQGELLDRLRQTGAANSDVHWWPVVRQLLTLVTPAEFKDLLSALDLSDLVTFRNVSLAAAARGDRQGLEELLPIALSSDIAYQHQLLEALAELPAALDATALHIAIELVRSGEHKSALNAAQFAAERIARNRNSPPESFAELLDTIPANRALREHEVHANGFVLRSWRDAKPDVQPAILALLRARLGSFAPATRASILELFHDVHIPVEEKEALVDSLLDQTLPRELYLPMTPILVDVLPRWVGRSDDARWTDWDTVLHAPLPKGWGIVATAVGHIVGTDPAHVRRLLEDLLQSDPRRTSRNVAALLGAVSNGAASTTAAYLVRLGAQVADSRTKPLRELAEAVLIHGDERTRLSLFPWAVAVADDHPRLALPLLARLLEQQPAALDTLLNLLSSFPLGDQPDAIKFALERAPASARNTLAEALLQRGITAALPASHPSLADFYGALLPSRPDVAATLVSLATGEAQTAATAASRVLAAAAGEVDCITAAELIPVLQSRFPGARTAVLDGMLRIMERGKPIPEDVITRVAHVLSRETNPIVVQPFCELLTSWIRKSGTVPVDLLRAVGGLMPRLQDLGTLNRGIARAALGALKDIAQVVDASLLPELEQWTRDSFLTINAEAVIDGEWRFTELLGEMARRDPTFLSRLVEAIRSLPSRNQKVLAVVIRRVQGTSSPLLRDVDRQPWATEEVRRIIAGMSGA